MAFLKKGTKSVDVSRQWAGTIGKVDNFMVRFRKYFEPNPKKRIYFESLRLVGYIFDHELKE